MAKQTMKWELLEEVVLACTHLDDEDRQQMFDLTELYPDYREYNEVQKNIIAYGVKQKLADSCARSKDQTLTSQERTEQMDEVYSRMVSGDWNQKGIERQTLNKKLKAAKEAATEAELAILRKLGLIQ